MYMMFSSKEQTYHSSVVIDAGHRACLVDNLQLGCVLFDVNSIVPCNLEGLYLKAINRHMQDNACKYSSNLVLHT